MAQAFTGISRIKRHIRTARLQDGEQRDHHADAALHAQRHAIFRIHTERDQTMRKPIRARIELRIRERFVFEEERDGIGRASNLLLEQLMDARIRRIGGARAVPCLDQQLADVRGHHVQPIHRRTGRLFQRIGEARKRLLHVSAQLHGREGRNGLRGEFEAVAVVVHRKGQRIVGALLGAEQFDAIERAFIGRALIVAIVEQRAEERRGSGDATASLRERERRMLMLQQSCETFMRGAHAVDDRGIVHVEAYRQSIDQEPERLIDARLHAPE
ncbi:hypothetical protein AWB76_06557 [Caballeronia temeraria]|uniref:Uncharacterized protein n=1 Tax=Caballeronia temeraria TaxID=1777137 RepID=A0A158D7X0_9BURK|nr:hypothetical protein AWB76_06557 [Caballeronia temeraria]